MRESKAIQALKAFAEDGGKLREWNDRLLNVLAPPNSNLAVAPKAVPAAADAPGYGAGRPRSPGAAHLAVDEVLGGA